MHVPGCLVEPRGPCAGDGNKHAKYYSEGHKKHCESQGFMELQNSLISGMARAFFSHYNEGQPFASRVEIQFFDNNSVLAGNSTEADIYCMPAQVISFGASPGSHAARQELRQRLMHIMKTAWYPSWNGPPGNLAEALTWTDKNSVHFSRISTSTRSISPRMICLG